MGNNFFDNFNITRSKTIKFCERPKCNFFHLNSQGESATSQIFHNSINQFSRINSISSINSSIVLAVLTVALQILVIMKFKKSLHLKKSQNWDLCL